MTLTLNLLLCLTLAYTAYKLRTYRRRTSRLLELVQWQKRCIAQGVPKGLSLELNAIALCKISALDAPEDEWQHAYLEAIKYLPSWTVN